jgi:hypothetical protein
MERFMLDGFQDAELYAELAASDMFPLVRELEFKYGLKVVRKGQARNSRNYTALGTWLMAHKNGLMVCEVFTSTTGGKNKDEREFCYRSPYYSKARGSNYEDRSTIRSAKVSSLMATLTRQKAVPTVFNLTEKILNNCSSAKNIMIHALGDSNKRSAFTSDEVHALLTMVLGKNPDGEDHVVDLNKCKKTLDEMDAADKIKQEKLVRSQKMFGEPFFFVGVDEKGNYLVGKYKWKPKAANLTLPDESNFETLEPMKRYRSYTEVHDLIPVMTMVTQIYEGKKATGGMPVTDEYNPDLDAVFFYNGTPTDYECAYMVTPCPA